MKDNLSLWAFGHAMIMLLSVIVGMLYDAKFVLLWTVTISIAGLITFTSPHWRKLHPPGGFANLVTLARFILLIVALSFQEEMSPWLFVLLIILAMVADGIDGFLARRFHQATEYGEVFDLEVDAFLAIALSVLIWKAHPEAAWVLVAGSMRYLFVILYRMIGWHRKQHPGMREAKVLAVLFFLSLLTPFVLEWSLARWIVGVGCILVTISFIREFYLIARVK